MSVKQVKIRVPGGDISVSVPIESDTTVAEALEAASLENDFNLISSDGQKIYPPSDRLDPLVNNGDTLYASLRTKVGGDFTVTETQAIAIFVFVVCVIVITIALVIVSLFTKERQKNTSAKNNRVERTLNAPLLWKYLGWQQSGTHFSGEYRAGVYRLPGKIHFQSKWDQRFEILAPESLIKACGQHSGCFVPFNRSHPTGQRWYKVHFRRRPHSVTSGILALQQLLDSAAVQVRGKSA